MANEAETTTKPLGRSPKIDISYVKLDKYVDERAVEGWIRRAEECVRLMGYKGEEAAGYILYYFRGRAKIELCSHVDIVTIVIIYDTIVSIRYLKY